MILLARSFNTDKHGTLLELWEVGSRKPKIIQRPFDPFFYSLIDLPGSKPIEKRLLENLSRERTVWEKSFTNTWDLRKERDRAYTFQDDIPYIQLVAAREGFKKASAEPRHRTFDIEMGRGKLIACGWGKRTEREVFTGTQETIISNLNEAIEYENPDILDSYWGTYFDAVKLEAISKKTGIPLKWGRDGSKPYIKRRKYSHGPKKGYHQEVRIRGRLFFDVYTEVGMDQTLSGIKNKKLQTVAHWFGLGEPTLIDHRRLLEYGMDVVKNECAEDVRKTWDLAEHYLQNLYHLADILDLPLNLVMERSPSHIPNYIYMREYDKLGIVACKNNAERFKQFFVWGRKSYEGALTKLYNPGIYGMLKKIDFRSMYPTIMACFYLDPLTVDFQDLEYCDPPSWIVKFKDDKISVYDANLRGVFTCRIKTEESVSQRWIRQLMEWRKGVRANPELSSTEKTSRQWAIKVIMNAIYGYHGMRYARLGYAPIAAIVTGIGRWWMAETIKFVDQRMTRVRDNQTIIEVDTDGLYYVGEDYAEEAEEYIRSLIPERYDTSFVRITTERYDGGIFYEEKGYVLKEGEDLKFHGSGLVGRHHPRICDKVLDEVVKAVFAGKDIKDILWDYTKLKRFSFRDFIMTVELRKKPDEYKEGTMIEKMLRHIPNPELGMEIQYVKTKDGFRPIGYQLGVEENLDYSYYRHRLAKMLSRILKPTKRLAVSTIKKMIEEGQMVLG